MTIYDLIKENPEVIQNLTVNVKVADLMEIARYCFEQGKKDQPLVIHEEYLTPTEVGEMLKISQVTLWSWDKKGITKPIHIGNKKLYKKSDIEKSLNNGKDL